MREGCADVSNSFTDLSDSAMQSDILVRVNSFSSAFDFWYESVSVCDPVYIEEIVVNVRDTFVR